MDKKAVRLTIKNEKRHYTEQQLSEWSLSLYNKVMNHPRVSSAKTLLLYYSMPDEAGTHKLVDALWRAGKTVLLPRVKDSTHMDLVAYTGPECLKAAGPFHILEPQGEPFTRYSDIEVAIVPGVAFTRDGKRMGHGRGYYDRMLALMPNTYKIGMCFAFQLLPDLPTSPYDINMDEVVC